MIEVTDPEIIAKVKAKAGMGSQPAQTTPISSNGLREVTDPNIIAKVKAAASQSRPQEPDFESMISNATKPMIDLSGGRKADRDYFTKMDEVPELAPAWAKNHPLAYTLANRTKDMVSPTLGALAFTGGGAVGGPYGAGLMGAKERQLERIYDVYMGREKKPSLTENLLQSGKDFAYGTSLEGVSKFLGGMKSRKPTPGALHAEEQAKDIGVDMLPSELRESKSLAQIEAGMGRLLGSSSLLQAHDKKNIMAIIKEAKGIVSTSGSPTNKEDLGRLIYDKVDNYLKTHANYDAKRLETIRNVVKRQIGSDVNPVKLSETAAEGIQSANKSMYDKGQELYKKRNALIPKEGVELNNTLKTAEKLNNVFSKTPPTEVNSKLRGRINEIIKLSEQEAPVDTSTLESLWQKPQIQKVIPKADLNTLSGFKSNINADLTQINPSMKYGLEGIKGATRPGQSLEARAYAELANSMERDINSYSKASGKGLTEANSAAIKYWKEFRQATNDKDFARILRSKPNEVLDQINDVSDVMAVKRVMGEEKFNKLVKPAFTNKIFGEGAEGFSPDKAAKAIIQHSRVIPKVYSPDEIKFMERAIKLGDIVNTRLEHIDKKFLGGLIRAQDPRTIVDSIFTGGKSKYAQRNVGYIYKISDKETKDKLKYFLSEKVLFGNQRVDPSTLLTDNTAYMDFNFNTLVKNIQNNESVIREFHGKETVDRIKRLANIGKYLQSSGKYAGLKIAETGQSTWALTQLGAFVTAISHGKVISAMNILFGPSAAASIYLSKPVSGAIGHGKSLPDWLKVGTKYGALAATRGTKTDLQE